MANHAAGLLDQAIALLGQARIALQAETKGPGAQAPGAPGEAGPQLPMEPLRAAGMEPLNTGQMQPLPLPLRRRIG